MKFLIFIFLFNITIGYSLPYTKIPHLDTAIYYLNIPVKEKTNSNDGYYVEKFLKYIGLGSGYKWCAAFSSYCIGVTKGIINKIKTSYATSFIKTYSINIKSVIRGEYYIPPGAIIILRNGSTRFGHVGFVYYWDKNSGQTIEGNANDRVSFMNRTYQPRNYQRIEAFTIIKYTLEIQKRIDTIKTKPILNIQNDVQRTI